MIDSPSFATLDARVAYQLWPALELYVGALNLTNTKRNPLVPTDNRPALGHQFYVGLRGELPAN